jgi:uncharacterized DUF497 family protein
LKIKAIIWRPDRVEHLAKHNITPEEVEEAVFDTHHAYVQVQKKADSFPNQKVYRCLSITEAGRYIIFIFINKGGGKVLPITARDMKDAERRYYEKKR